MKRLIPERTVDSLLAAEVVRHDPYSLIWSPTNTTDSWDHAVQFSMRGSAIFECKAVQAENRYSKTRWSAPIRLLQLYKYVFNCDFTVHYLVLGKPREPLKPAQRNRCRECSFAWCKACCRDSRSWAALESPLGRAWFGIRLQPWFCHWARVIPAKELATLLDLDEANPPNAGEEARLSLEDSRLESKGYVTRLCHFLDDAASGEAVISNLLRGVFEDGDRRDVDMLQLMRSQLLAANLEQNNDDSTLPIVVNFN